MKSKYYIGIDTSNYTTSISVIDNWNNIVLDYRKILDVKIGKKGLRQQEAVFQHIKQMPLFIENISSKIDIKNVQAVGVSVRPRDFEESYMPVFVVSQSIGKIISSILDIEYKEFSHQVGHIASGVFGSDFSQETKFLSLHISGGTTELLLVNKTPDGYKTELIGGSKDISFGQLIDRIGVKLNLGFPCGKELENISSYGNLIDIDIPIKKNNDTWINLSGLETFFYKLIEKNIYKKEDLAKTLFNTLSIIIKDMISNSITKFNMKSVLVVGGVASNKYIKNKIKNDLNNGNLYFPNPNYCTDNSIGLAYLCSL